MKTKGVCSFYLWNFNIIVLLCDLWKIAKWPSYGLSNSLCSIFVHEALVHIYIILRKIEWIDITNIFKSSTATRQHGKQAEPWIESYYHQLAIATNAQTVKSWAPAMLRIRLTEQVIIKHPPSTPCHASAPLAPLPVVLYSPSPS
jgi:hypothetical protein